MRGLVKSLLAALSRTPAGPTEPEVYRFRSRSHIVNQGKKPDAGGNSSWHALGLWDKVRGSGTLFNDGAYKLQFVQPGTGLASFMTCGTSDVDLTQIANWKAAKPDGHEVSFTAEPGVNKLTWDGSKGAGSTFHLAVTSSPKIVGMDDAWQSPTRKTILLAFQGSREELFPPMVVCIAPVASWKGNVSCQSGHVTLEVRLADNDADTVEWRIITAETAGRAKWDSVVRKIAKAKDEKPKLTKKG